MAARNASSGNVGSMVARFEGLRGNSAPCCRKLKSPHRLSESHPLAPFFARWWRICQRSSSRLPEERRPAPLDLPTPLKRSWTPTCPTKKPQLAQSTSSSVWSLPSPSRSRFSGEDLLSLSTPGRKRSGAAAAATVVTPKAGGEPAPELFRTPERRPAPWSPGSLTSSLEPSPAPTAKSPALPSAAQAPAPQGLAAAKSDLMEMGRLLAQVDTLRSRVGKGLEEALAAVESEERCRGLEERLTASEERSLSLEKRLASSEQRVTEAQRRLAEAEAEKLTWEAQKESMEVELEVLRNKKAAPPPAPGVPELAKAARDFLQARSRRSPKGESAGALQRPTMGEFSMIDCEEEDFPDFSASVNTLANEYEGIDIVTANSIVRRGGQPSPWISEACSNSEGEDVTTQLAAAAAAVQALAAARGVASSPTAESEAAVFMAVGQTLAKCYELCRLARLALPENGGPEELSMSIQSTEACLLDAVRVAGAGMH